MLPFALTYVYSMYHNTCLSLCMCVCVTSLRVGMFPGSLNSEQNRIYGIEHFHSNGASPVVLLIDLDLHFQGQTFGN